MEELQLRVRIDAAGNLRGLYPGAQENAPILLIGSHLDTVPNAGAYDGVLGVALAIALLEELRGRRLPFAVEVVGFSEEEGVRFGAPFIGSRALVGRLDQELLQVRDADGITVEGAIKAFGLNPEDIRNAALEPDALGYLEFHIEQGPVLESCDRPLAAVEAIVGQSRLELVLTGRANHSGTAPMHLRFDALAGAAEWIGEVEQFAKSTPGIAATVGTIEVSPGATNVIAGEARLTLDLRHCSDHVRTRSVEELIRRADQIAARRGLSVQKRSLLNQPAVAMDPFLTGEIEKAIGKIGCTPHRMASGAGHDAMIMAERVPSGMVFLRSPGGISHDPAESVLAADVEKAIACGFQLLDQLAASPAFHQTRFTKG
jgi:allantoate deiminase